MNAGDPYLDLAAGRIIGAGTENKFGRAPDVDSGVLTDIHDGANSTDAVTIWVAPTEARIHAVVSDDASDVCGIGTLTLTGLPLDTETVVIGSKTYTWQDTLTDVDGNVHIAGDASDSIDNLIAAINLGAGAGTDYALSMTAGNDVVAAAGAGDTMSLFDEQSQALATTETLTNGSWGAANTVSGASARTIRVYGLTSWTEKEANEDIALHGTVSVNTVGSYVIIHRLEVLSEGSTSINAGVIKATAATDATVTAQINALEGQTQMAIYGIPSIQTAYITLYYASIIKAAAATNALAKFVVNTDPQNELTTFVVKHTKGSETVGNNSIGHEFKPYFKVPGPAIIKVQADAGAANTNVSGGFDVIIEDN